MTREMAEMTEAIEELRRDVEALRVELVCLALKTDPALQPTLDDASTESSRER